MSLQGVFLPLYFKPVFRLNLRAVTLFRIALALSLMAGLILQAGILEANSTAPGRIVREAKKQAEDPARDYRGKKGGLKKAYTPSPDPRISIATLPKRKFHTLDVHEHVRDETEALKLLRVMDQLKIGTAVLMGTSRYTFTLNPRYGFEQYEENNEAILNLAKKYPERFAAFPTILPTDAQSFAKIQDYVRRGAQGLKLYLGHGGKTGKEPFHLMRLDDPRMKSIYAWAQANQLPIMFHVNLNKYHDEFLRVMEEFPYLRVCVPHFGLFKKTQRKLDRLAWFLERYPNLYTDIGVGWYEFQIADFQTVAGSRERFRVFFIKNAAKIMFSSDMVLEPTKDIAYIRNTLRSYFQLLEMKRFRFFYRPRYLMQGLDLPDSVQKQIYEETPTRFLLMDSKGRFPDRRKGLPSQWKKGVPGLPPAVPSVAPLDSESAFSTPAGKTA